ncbi:MULTISPECIES: hypothetical protein [Nostocales]|uniref:Uncharacterized protein n=3 Tax=Nostocales TaxID=1161 RepID=A0A0C1RAP4_9CYAN|nr:hypothetical protein [Tolypothrix bouteillei]KAF3884840.1 hypothetical protein DA73_0400004770 [Tolypothrix bouteillei VB521301]
MKQHFPLRQMGFPLVGLVLMLGTFASQTKAAFSNDFTPVKVTNNLQQVNALGLGTPSTNSQRLVKNSTSALSRAKIPQKDGIYLYGESPKPSQLGQGYIVFEKQQGKVLGALYMPHSEFSCFNGTLDSRGELAMTVTGYPGDKNPAQIATSSSVPRLIDDEVTTYDHSIALQTYHPLNASADDRRILQMCKNQL